MSGVVALDLFDEEGTKYMRDVFPDAIQQGHRLHQSWPEHAVGLFVAKSKITADLIASTKKLKYIIRHGAEHDNIDVEACKSKGINVCNLPGISVGCTFNAPSYTLYEPRLTMIKAMSVAEVALALTGACAKNLIELSRQMRDGEVLNKRCKSLFSASLLTGKTFGIVGGGRIGLLTAKKLCVRKAYEPLRRQLTVLKYWCLRGKYHHVSSLA